MSRNLLHKSKLEAFKSWLDANGIPNRPGKGDFQLLQVCKDGKHWNCIYSRIEMAEHVTVDRHLESLVRRFCREMKS